MAAGMFFAVTCSEDHRLVNSEAIERETAGRFLRDSLFRTRWAACDSWPQGDVPESYFEPVRSEKPVLLLSGGLDPVTPPSWAEQAAATLPSSAQLVAPSVGHGVAAVGCGMNLVERFLEDPRPEQTDGSCLQEIERPPFFVTPVSPMEPSTEARP